MSYKIAVMVRGESKPSYNGIRVETEQEATWHGNDLFSRWMLMESFTVEQSDDPVNYKIDVENGVVQAVG
jgi:hypothetical protein